ncbi:Ig-like domain-containing protein, partial [Colwellia sp. C1TZA3]|uniref:Ig-like domain-containing protein n=1 Tax=Colwellia sp. C1TZA3 TaxID=2508879 RepID=UPI0011B9A605
VYNAAELAAGAAGTVTATITMPGDAVAGDILTYQVGTDSPVDIALTDVNIASGIAVEVDSLAVITASITDMAGNISTQVTATALDKDTGITDIAGTVIGITAGLTDATNSALNTDTITNDNTPDIAGITEPGSSVVITAADGKILGSGTADATTGAYSITLSPLADGVDIPLTVTATDAAGNTATAGPSVTIDTGVNSADVTETNDLTAGLTDATNSALKADIITNDNRPGIAGITEAGSSVVITDADDKILGTAIADADGAYSITLSDLADGTDIPLTVTATDVAGNIATATPKVTVDTTVAMPSITLDNDSGSSASDTITNDEALIFSAAAADVTRVYSIDGAAAATEYSAPTVDGEYTVTVTDTDTAGNVKTASTTFTLDTTLAIPTVGLTTDSGTLNDDVITNDAALSFSEAASDVNRTYSIDGAAATTEYSAPTVDGEYTVTVTDTDIAGNVKTASTTFTLDTTLAIPTVGLTTDSGTLNDDVITNDAALSFS